MRHARLRFWCDLTVWPLIALACLALWLLIVAPARAAALPKDDPAPVTVWRFYNERTGVHFYTADAAERQYVLANYPNMADEGAAYRALPSPGTDTTPVWRFYNTETGAHFYTA